MSRLSGHHVQMGGAFRLDPLEDKQKEVVHEIILEAESRAYTLVENARRQAQQIVADAHAQAQQTIQNAEIQQETILQQAYQTGEASGQAKGYEDGYARAEQETVRLIEGSKVLLEGAYISRSKVMKSFRSSAGLIIRHLTERILAQALEMDPTLLFGILDQAIESQHITGRVRVVISSEVLETVRNFSGKSQAALDSMARFEFIGDPKLAHSEIFLLSEEGNFTLMPERQIQQLLTPLVKELPLPEGDEDAEEPEEEDSEESLEAELHDINAMLMAQAETEPTPPTLSDAASEDTL